MLAELETLQRQFPDKQLEPALQAFGDKTISVARIPVKTGLLKRVLRAEVRDDRLRFISPGANYGIYVEADQQFLARALDEGYDAFLDELADRWKRS